TAVGLETVRGFHNPGTQGPFGAAAAVGKLYALDEERLTSAMGIAGSSSAGLLEFAWSGGDTKRLHLGRAAQLGLESALLARHGVLGGQYSLPFTTAVALTRDMSNPLVYDAGAVADPLVRDLARRIELEPLPEAPHESPGFWPAEITIECGSERHTLHTRPHKGSPLNPFTWDDAVEKFRRYTASVLSAQRATAIVDAVGGLDKTADLADVAPLLAS